MNSFQTCITRVSRDYKLPSYPLLRRLRLFNTFVHSTDESYIVSHTYTPHASLIILSSSHWSLVPGHYNSANATPNIPPTILIIQNRIVTCVSDQPIISKWWCSGAILNSRLPP